MYDALRSRDACNKDLLSWSDVLEKEGAVNPEFNQMFSISR